MKKLIFTIAVIGGTLVSCNSEQKWTEQDETEFVSNCESSFITGFENSVGDKISDVDKEELNKLAKNYCSCAFESIKNKYKSPDEALELTVDKLLKEAQKCEPNQEERERLMKKDD